MNKRYDVVVAGAGLGGLSAAAHLAQAGQKVLVLERNNVPGGHATSFRRGRFEFEAALPELCPMGTPGGPGGVRERPDGDWVARARGHEISLAFEKRIRELGGEIWYNCEAAKIDIKDNAVRGVELASGRCIPCERVISGLTNAHGPARSVLTVYLGLDIPCEELGFQAYDSFVRFPDGTLQRCENAAMAGHGDYGVTILDNLLAGACAPGSCMVQFARFCTEDTFADVTEEEYFQRKERIARETIEDFERVAGIDLQSHIEEAVVASPVTWFRYLGTPPEGIAGDVPPAFGAERLAASLHPHVQHVRVSRVIDRGSAKSFVLQADKERGTEKLAYFRAGQYVSVLLPIGHMSVCKPYSLQSSPKDALAEESSYTLTISHNPGGFASEYILENWQEGSRVMISAPLGHFYYSDLRDAPHVMCLAGGSGVTPFFSMAAAVADGIEDFTMTLLYGNETRADILLREELEEIAVRSRGRVKLVHVLSGERAEGCEHGLISAELVKKYAPEGDWSVFLCGPRSFYAYQATQLPRLEKPRRRIRPELFGEVKDPTPMADYPRGLAEKTFRVRVVSRDKTWELSCGGAQSLLSVMEKAGIPAQSDCRSGECGWCRARLVEGTVYVPERVDGRRMADAKFGWVHPCCSFPTSDVVLEIHPMMG